MYALIDSTVGQFVRTDATLLTATAALDPELVAVSAAGRELTYGELDALSGKLAERLAALGASETAHVVMALPASIESVTAVWAVAKTGAALASIDADDAQVHAALATDWRVQIGITTAAHRASLPDSVTWLVLDEPAANYRAELARAA